MQQSWQGAILATFVAGSLIVFLYSKVNHTRFLTCHVHQQG